MVTQMNKTRGVPSEKETAKAAETRRDGLVDAAIKADQESSVTIRMGFGSALFHALDTGQTYLLNKLFLGLTAGTAVAMRSMAIPASFELYAESVGYVKDAETDKWLADGRPFQLVRFVSDPRGEGALDSKGQRNHFQIVSVTEGAESVRKLADGGAKARKLKQAIIAGGEKALQDLHWVAESKRLAEVRFADPASAARSMVRALKDWAKGIATNGKQPEDIVQIARIARLGDAVEADLLKTATDALLASQNKGKASGETVNAREAVGDDKVEVPAGATALPADHPAMKGETAPREQVQAA